MKFETERIYLVKWRFWFVVWSTMATWRKDFSSLLAKKKATTTTLNIQSTLFFTFLWRCFARLQCETLCWKMSYMLTDSLSCSCSFFFYTAVHFHLVGRLFSFSHRHSHVFSPTKFVPCFLSNASALLLMSLKTLKFSRTWLCFWFFSLLSPDGLSLSKKSGWT